MDTLSILVTGGSGFIGSHLVDYLVDLGHEVTVLDRRRPRFGNGSQAVFIRGDITDEAVVARAVLGKQYVFHLAGQVGTTELLARPVSASMSNIVGSAVVLEACRKIGSRLVQVSKPMVWLNAYTVTKRAAEELTAIYIREFGVEAVILRPFNAYGPRQSPHAAKKAVPHWIIGALRDEALDVYGDGTQTMDLIHVTDVVRAMGRLLDNEAWEKTQGGTFEIGSGEETSVNEAVRIIQDVVGMMSGNVNPLTMRLGETEGTRLRAKSEPFRELTGWLPMKPLREGIAETVAWYRVEMMRGRLNVIDPIQDVWCFSPAFRTGPKVCEQFESFVRLDRELAEQGIAFHLLIIDDGSNDYSDGADTSQETVTWSVLKALEAKHGFLTAWRNEDAKGRPKNLKNRATLVRGYGWATACADPQRDLVATLDSDGEHDPMELQRALKLLQTDDHLGGVIGTIEFPENMASEIHRVGARFLGLVQSDYMRLEEKTTIQSCGFNLFRASHVIRGFGLLPSYEKFFKKRYGKVVSLPGWGFHAVMQTLMIRGSGCMARVLFLQCMGPSPNRTPEKMAQQAMAALIHQDCLVAFFDGKGYLEAMG